MVGLGPGSQIRPSSFYGSNHGDREDVGLFRIVCAKVSRGTAPAARASSMTAVRSIGSSPRVHCLRFRGRGPNRRTRVGSCSSTSSQVFTPTTSSLLTRHADRLEGRFLARWAGFMEIRDADQAPESVSTVGDVRRVLARQRTSTRCRGRRWCRGSSRKRVCPANSRSGTAAPPDRGRSGRCSALVMVHGVRCGWRRTTPASARCAKTGRPSCGTCSRLRTRCGMDSAG